MLFQDKGTSINSLPSPSMIIETRVGDDILPLVCKFEGVEEKTPETKPDLDHVARQVQNLFKFKIFYDEMDFNTNLTFSSQKQSSRSLTSWGGSNSTNKSLNRINLEEDWVVFINRIANTT